MQVGGSGKPVSVVFGGAVRTYRFACSGQDHLPNKDTPERPLLHWIEERSTKADDSRRAIKDQCCNWSDSSFGPLKSGGATLCGALTNLVAKYPNE